VLNIELVSLGSINKTIVEPMEVFSVPLQKRAVKIILVHNHPSGELKPSDSDKDITDNLIQAGRIMHVPVLDHLIISERSYYSFKDNGLLDQLEKSLKYVPAYEIKRRYEEKAKQVGNEEGQKEKAREMARAMKQNGEPMEKIVAYTGLKESTINRLKVD
jgi:DNA repair protein RadC